MNAQMQTPEEIARFFKALSVPTRVRLLQLLRGQALCVNALAGCLGLSPAAVSQHLRVLRHLGLVAPDKRGYFVHYHLRPEVMASWQHAAREALSPQGPIAQKREDTPGKKQAARSNKP